jgi:DNA-binding MarR family transcriptional regulator
MANHRGDRFDDIARQWREERPDLDPSPGVLLGRISTVARLLSARAKRLLRSFDLTPWEYEVLATLRRSGPNYELAPRRLLDALLISSPALTNRLDHLERAGLVERRGDPADRRALIIRLTPAGHVRADAAVTAYMASEHVLLEGFTPGERAGLERALRKLLGPLTNSEGLPTSNREPNSS